MYVRVARGRFNVDNIDEIQRLVEETLLPALNRSSLSFKAEIFARRWMPETVGWDPQSRRRRAGRKIGSDARRGREFQSSKGRSQTTKVGK
jgi:hypothetical protein